MTFQRIEKAGQVFICEQCHGKFKTNWVHDQAVKEYEAEFKRPYRQIEVTIVCDDCFNLITEEEHDSQTN